ncbi:MAG: bacterioferritin [Gammaproteobacteria bacterium]|nr:bacterioferritin [Gammaproteobacteria bacterium]
MQVQDSKVFDYLNAVLKNELTAINQYFLHSRMLQDFGLNRLAKHEYEESIEEMKHADSLVQRILLLEGVPNLQELGHLRIGERPEEMLKCDLELEMQALQDLRDGIEYCESVRDYVTRDLFASILDNEEEHVDWIETQLDLIKRIGVESYLEQQMHE